MINKHLSITLVFLVLLTILNIFLSVMITEGNFTYALDDAYIHLSIAKNFAEKGIWSVDGFGLSNASSSPLWNFILSPFYLLLGVRFFVFVPFFLNVIFQLLSISLIFKIIKKQTDKILHFGFGILLVLITPFFALSIGGMEHSLQIFLVLLLIQLFLKYVNNQNNSKVKNQMLLISPFVVFVRYEDFALIVAMSLFILLYLREWKFFLKLIFSSLLFVFIFGFWTEFILGLGFIPNSIVTKSVVGYEFNLLSEIKKIFFHLFENLSKTYLIVLYIINCIVCIKSYFNNKKEIFALSIIFILTFLTHLTFARIGWLYRYEAYLIVFGFLNILLFIYQLKPKEFLISLLILISMLPFYAYRILFSEYQSIVATKNIYEQQYQMASFLKKECNDCSVAANDIGAITYFTNIKLLDLYGLNNQEVIKHKKNGTYNNQVINQLIKDHNTSLIVIYNSWFDNIQFDDFIEIGTWQIKNNEICGDEKVNFYSLKEKRNYFSQRLYLYSNKLLPKNVVYEFKSLVSDKTQN